MRTCRVIEPAVPTANCSTHSAPKSKSRNAGSIGLWRFKPICSQKAHHPISVNWICGAPLQTMKRFLPSKPHTQPNIQLVGSMVRLNPPPSQGEQNLSQRPTPCFDLFTARGTHGAGAVPQEAAVEVPLQILLAKPKAPDLGLSL